LPSVHNKRRIGSNDYCGKGQLPKRKRVTYVQLRWVCIEEMQDCHVGDYMEGYLTHGNDLLNKFLCSSWQAYCCFLRYIGRCAEHTSAIKGI